MNARRLNDPAARAEDWGRPMPEDSDFGSSGSRGGPRGRGRDGRVQEGRGRGTGRGRGGLPAKPEARLAPVDQEAGEANNGQPVSMAEVSAAAAKPDIGGTVAGLGGYASGSASDASSSSDSSDSSSSDSDSDDSESENEGTALGEKKGGDTGRSPTKGQGPPKPMCRSFAKNGKCRFGNKCHYSHVRQLADLFLENAVADISRTWCQKGTRRARSLRSTGNPYQSNHRGRGPTRSRGHPCWELYVLTGLAYTQKYMLTYTATSKSHPEHLVPIDADDPVPRRQRHASWRGSSPWPSGRRGAGTHQDRHA